MPTLMAAVDAPVASTGPLMRAVRALADVSLLALICSALLGLLAIFVPLQLSSDGWFALVAGRLIVSDGLPHHDTLAALTSGRAWIDQQWLGQLATYGFHAAGGLRLMLLANVALVWGAFVAAVSIARGRGAYAPTIAVVGAVSLLPFVATASAVRTQSLVYLPFVAIIAILTSSTIRPRDALFLLTLLVVWANVHGSVLLAALLVALRGVIGLWESRGASSRRRVEWLLLLAPVCVFASPYQLHLVGYYKSTVFNSSFSAYLGQWAPTSFSPISAPLLVLIFLTAWVLGRSAVVYSNFERCLLGLSILLGLVAIRNWPFATLLVLMLAPVGVDRAVRRRAPRRAPAVGAAITVAAGAAALIGTITALTAPSAKLTRNYPDAAAAAAATIASTRPGAQIYGGIQYSDWLLWKHPELRGRVVFDVRYELLRSSEVKRLVLFSSGSGLGSPLGSPDVYVLDPHSDADAIAGLHGTIRIVYKTKHALVAVTRQPR